MLALSPKDMMLKSFFLHQKVLKIAAEGIHQSLLVFKYCLSEDQHFMAMTFSWKHTVLSQKFAGK